MLSLRSIPPGVLHLYCVIVVVNGWLDVLRMTTMTWQQQRCKLTTFTHKTFHLSRQLQFENSGTIMCSDRTIKVVYKFQLCCCCCLSSLHCTLYFVAVFILLFWVFFILSGEGSKEHKKYSKFDTKHWLVRPNSVYFGIKNIPEIPVISWRKKIDKKSNSV